MVNTCTRTILLVDDNPLVLRMLKFAFSAAGYSVHADHDSVNACQAHERGEIVPDILITDLCMPRMGGVEMAQRMRRKQPGLPIIFISGDPTARSMPTYEMFPNHVFLTKPFLPSRLIGILANHFAGL